MAKELERAGIPTTLICTIVPVATALGSNRVVAAKAITHPLGDPSLPAEQELAFRESLVRRAPAAPATGVREPTVFAAPAQPVAEAVPVARHRGAG